jgi:hypothetical protein
LCQVTHLLCPMSRRRGLPSPALLFGTRPVWYCGGNSCGGCSAFGRSCRNRSMVNCALGSRSDEFALDRCASCAASSSGTCGIWRDASLPIGADGRLEMMRDSMLKMCLYRIYRWKETERDAECEAQIRNAVNADSPSVSPSPDPVHGAVKRDTSELTTAPRRV